MSGGCYLAISLVYLLNWLGNTKAMLEGLIPTDHDVSALYCALLCVYIYQYAFPNLDLEY